MSLSYSSLNIYGLRKFIANERKKLAIIVDVLCLNLSSLIWLFCVYGDGF